VDFTDPKYIHLICTDLGMFNTAEVSDGLIKMFK
jgi:translation initiation factor 2B subunit (eIF-2B alpha/beta/delta family)